MAYVTDTNGLSVPYREIWKCDIVSRDRNSIPPNGFDSRYPLTPHHHTIGAIKKSSLRNNILDSFENVDLTQSKSLRFAFASTDIFLGDHLPRCGIRNWSPNLSLSVKVKLVICPRINCYGSWRAFTSTRNSNPWYSSVRNLILHTSRFGRSNKKASPRVQAVFQMIDINVGCRRRTTANKPTKVMCRCRFNSYTQKCTSVSR